ncbi:hypothetical protein HK23_03105 [Acetobacter malorum]|uniref:DUF1496 domain-containing protein n=1 Tax=Acetobacter malorum TaxID=178901 RepID=A0A1Y3G668_9PROT|nr:hypothetical protein HK23_03105 [Acetobacter malorum]
MKKFRTFVFASMSLTGLLVSYAGVSPKAQATVSLTSSSDVGSYLRSAEETHHHLIVTYPNGQKCAVIAGIPVECWGGKFEP